MAFLILKAMISSNDIFYELGLVDMEEKTNDDVLNLHYVPIIIAERRIGIMLSKSDLEELKNAEFVKEEFENLPDISNIHPDIDEHLYNRAKLFFEYVKNPYLFRVGDIGVKVNFVGDKSFHDAVKNMVVDINER